LADKKLGSWSKTKVTTMKHKAVKTRAVLAIKHDAEGKKTRPEVRLLTQGLKEVPMLDLEEKWARVPNASTSRAICAVVASNGWKVHNVDSKTAFLNAKIDKEMDIKLSAGV